MRRSKTRFLIFAASAFAAVLLSACGGTDLDSAIIDGYTAAFDAAGKNAGSKKLRLSDSDYSNVKTLFDDDDTYCQADSSQQRWNHVKEVIEDNTAAFTPGDIDSTQWVGTADDRNVRIRVFLDNTEGMKGFLSLECAKNPSFVKMLSAVDEYASEHKYKDISSYYTQHKGQQDEIVRLPWADFKEEVMKYSLHTSYTDSYKLSDFLNAIADSVVADKQSGSINFFITDGMPSGTSAQIKANPQYNKLQADELKTGIRSAVQKLDGIGAVSVYQFHAPFAGSYIDYRNVRSKTNEERPFYVFAIGKESLVRQFKEDCESGVGDLKPDNAVHFFSSEKNVNLISTDLSDDGDDEYSVSDMAVKDGTAAVDGIKMTVPGIFADSASAKKAVSLKFNGKDIPFKPKGGRLEFSLSDIQDDDKLIVDIKNELPAWVDNSSTDDDSTPEGRQNRTFLLDRVLKGIMEAFFGSRNLLLEKEFTFKVDD